MVKQKRRNNNTNTFNSKCARHEEIVEEEIEEERIEGESRIEEIRIEDDDEEEGKEIEETENSDAESFEDSEVQDKSEDQTDKDKKERSFVWLHFKKFKDNYGVNWAKYKYCNKVKYKMDGKTCGSTGNLNKHLKNHLDKIDLSTRKQAKFIKKFLSEDNDEKIPFSNEIFREKLAIWVTMDDQPFTVTECPEFKELIKLCNGKVVLSCADTVRNDVLKLYENYRTGVKYKLKMFRETKL
ncbi:unnamed protein product [Rhizophagus irregularis]|nr:unnamed protein product [Rhizophagus irregularis]